MGTTLAMLLFLANAVDGREAALELQQGVRLLDSEAFDEAERHLRRAVVLAPASPEARYALGRLYMATARPAEAAVAFRSSLAAGRRAAPATRAAGLQGEHDAAVGSLMDERREAEILLRLGAALYRTGAVGEATTCFQRSVELRPTGEGYNNLAVALFASARVRDAREALAKAAAAGFPVNAAFRARIQAVLGEPRPDVG